MATKVPKLQKIHITRTRGVLEYQKNVRSFSTSLIIAKDMLDMYVKVRYKGALNVWDEIQDLKRKFYSMHEDYHRICIKEYQSLRCLAGWEYLRDFDNHIVYRQVLVWDEIANRKVFMKL